MQTFKKSLAKKRSRERGMALVFALLGILLLSMLAAALMFVTSAEAFGSMHYKSQTQARHAAMAGVQRSIDWFRTVYGPWLNPMGGTPPAPTTPPVAAGTYAWTPPTPANPTYGGNRVRLGDGLNFPDDSVATGAETTISDGFQTMRTTATTINLGNTNASYEILGATLLSHDRYVAPDGVTPRIVERWLVEVRGRVTSPLGDTVVVESAIVQPSPIPMFGNALHGMCEIRMVGSIETDSYYSTNGVYDSPPGTNILTGPDANSNVASNVVVGSSGGSGVINGDVYYGTGPYPGCGTTAGENLGGTTVTGDTMTYPPIPFPPVTPTFTTAPGGDQCNAGSGINIWTPNTPSSNNLGLCRLTGTERLLLRVPDGNTAVTFFIRGLDVQTNNNFVQVQHASTGLPCSLNDPIGARCAPVSLYISTTMQLGGGGVISTFPVSACDPTRFSVFFTGSSGTLGGTSGFCGTMYAPDANVSIAGDTEIWGAVSAEVVETNGGVQIHYDRALERMRVMLTAFRVVNHRREVN